MKTNARGTAHAPDYHHANSPGARHEDEILMRALQRREIRALNVLFRRYHRLFKSVILHVIHDEFAADDVMQESILEIWRHADRYSPQKGKPLGWMIVVCKRRAIDHLRRCSAYHRACDRMEADAAFHPVFPPGGVVGDCTERADLGAFLERHVTALPDSQEQVIRLAFLKGMSQREVASATETPLGTVKTRIELGLKKLKSALKAKGACDKSFLHELAMPT